VTATTSLLVIGAGPYALSTAAFARHHGVDTVVVGRPMGFWREHMPAGMFLRSGPDWHLDAAAVHTLEAYLEERAIAPADVDPLPIGLFLDYAEWFRQAKGIEVREDLVAERTRILSRLHVLLADLQPGGANRELSASRAAALLGRVHPITVVDVERKRIARELLADVRRLDRQVKTASQLIRQAVREHGTTLTQVYGVGPVLAAKLVGHTGDITRFPSQDHFASYTGTAPVEASSGDVRRHRLNRGGNRQLNTALHLIAVCQIRDVSPGQAFYQRKLAEAKTPEEARRSLKRHLANVVYGHLVTDHRHRTRAC